MDINQHIKLGCVGMTHLGLIHAVAFAEKGFDLICYDEKSELIQQLKQRSLPVNEPHLDELIEKNAKRLQFTADIKQLRQCQVVFIAYDVPTDDNGNSDLTIIEQLLSQVKLVLDSEASVVLLSQVPPGFTRRIDIDKDRLFYQVETLIFGCAMDRALYPERYIVGMANSNKPLPKAYQRLLDSFSCPILSMRYESAELAKISINMFLVASVTTTNTLAEICENIGADWQDIAPTLRLDKRIGQHAYLTPGLGIAGGNLERDLNTIIKLGERHQTDTDTVSAWLKNSRHRRDWAFRCIQQQALKSSSSPVIAILGLAYKPNTHSLKNSPSIALIKQLKAYHVKAHDPIVRDQHETHAVRYDDIMKTVQGADMVIIMTPCEEYKDLSSSMLLSRMRGRTVIDPYRILNVESQMACDYFSLGRGTLHIEQEDVEYA